MRRLRRGRLTGGPTPAGQRSLSLELIGSVIEVARLDLNMLGTHPRQSAPAPPACTNSRTVATAVTARFGWAASSCRRVLRRSSGLQMNAANAPVVAPAATRSQEGAGRDESPPKARCADRVSGSYSPSRNVFLLPSRNIAKRSPRCRPLSPSSRQSRTRQSASPPYARGAPMGISSRSMASRVFATSAGLVKMHAIAGPAAEHAMPTARSLRSPMCGPRSVDRACHRQRVSTSRGTRRTCARQRRRARLRPLHVATLHSDDFAPNPDEAE